MKKNTLLALASFLVLFSILVILLDSRIRLAGNDVKSPVDENIVNITELVDEEGVVYSLPCHIKQTRGTTKSFYTTLDYEFKDYTGPSFIMQANHYFTELNLDGELIYKVEPKIQTLGNYFTKVPLPTKLDDAKLEIKITTSKIGIDRYELTSAVIANEGYYLKTNLFKDIPSLALTTIILAVGIITCVLALITRHKELLISSLPKGLFAIVAAVYFYCETFTIVYIMPNARVTYLCCMVSFALIMPTLLLSIVNNVNEREQKPLKFCILIGLFNLIFQMVFCGSNITMFRNMLPLTHITQLIAVFVITYIFIDSYKNHHLKNDLVSLDLILVGAIGGLLDIVLYYLELSTYNVFFFKIALLVYFAKDLYKAVQNIVKRSNSLLKEDFYKSIAMHDSLTNVLSRVAYDLERKTWDKTKKSTIFSVDLNNLKEANDNFGHKVGDDLLIATGKALKFTFDKVGKTYRIGGDEFIVIVDDLSSKQEEVFVDKLRILEKEYNGYNESPVMLSFAVGVASTMETSGSLEDAIVLADERMYDNKNEIKHSNL